MKESFNRQNQRKNLEIERKNAENLRMSENAEILRAKLDQNQANFLANQRRVSARNRSRMKKEEERIAEMLDEG